MNKVPCTVGIFAHNEEANIGKLLTNMCEQRLQTVEIREIIVVSSGSFDETDSIVREYAAQDPRIKLLVQERREGKASAINLFLRQMTERVLRICSADLQPELDTQSRS
ncbi:MAG: glycosyltransferase family 2 protein [Chloroflexota bacterium]